MQRRGKLLINYAKEGKVVENFGFSLIKSQLYRGDDTSIEHEKDILQSTEYVDISETDNNFDRLEATGSKNISISDTSPGEIKITRNHKISSSNSCSSCSSSSSSSRSSSTSSSSSSNSSDDDLNSSKQADLLVQHEPILPSTSGFHEDLNSSTQVDLTVQHEPICLPSTSGFHLLKQSYKNVDNENTTDCEDFSPDDSGDEYRPEKLKRTSKICRISASSSFSSLSRSNSNASAASESILQESRTQQNNNSTLPMSTNALSLKENDTLPAVTSNMSNNESSLIDENDKLSHITKKRKRNENEWKKNKAKQLKNSGQEYTSRTGKIISAKEIKPPCSDKCRYKCSTNFSEAYRAQIFKTYWDLASLQRQRDFLNSVITVLQSMQRRLKVGVTNRKPNTCYTLLNNGKSYRVCKIFLINTLGVSERTLRTVIESKTGDGSIGVTPTDKRGKHGKQAKTDSDVLESVRNHIKSIERVESHYLRAHTTREYIDGGLTVAELHRDYKRIREENNEPAANYDTYYRIFNNEFNISFFTPKKDQCDLCESYKNAVGEQKEEIKESYDEHQRQKVLSRMEKKTDIEGCTRTENNTIVCIYDLQAVMPTPIGETSCFFYKSRLNCMNLTITDVKNKHTVCYFWHEGLGKRGAVEIGSCVLKFLQDVADNYPDSDIIFYSDNCCGQQENRYVFSMYLYAVKTLNIKSITHKFLVTGHTQNEGDTVHSIIEKAVKRARKSGPIYVPDQYVQIIRSAKKNEKLFDVQELGFNDFYDLKILADEVKLNTTKDNNGNVIKITDMRVIQFQKDSDNYRFKVRYEEDWIESKLKLKQRTSRRADKKIKDISLKAAYSSKLPIEGNKQHAIKELFKRNIIPTYYKNFYDSLFSN